MHRLRVSRLGTRPREVALHGDVTLGRHPDCVVSLPARSVSTHHARVHVGEDGCSVSDLGSSNGTLVDGQPIAAGTPLPLHGGERIVIGPYVLQYVPPQAAAQPDAATAPRGTPEGEDVLPPASAAGRFRRARRRRQAAALAFLFLWIAFLLWLVLGGIL